MLGFQKRLILQQPCCGMVKAPAVNHGRQIAALRETMFDHATQILRGVSRYQEFCVAQLAEFFSRTNLNSGLSPSSDF